MSVESREFLRHAVLAAVLAGFGLNDWNQAPQVPIAHGLGGVSVLRSLAFAAILLLLGRMLLAALRPALAARWSAASRWSRIAIFAAVLAGGTALEASGVLRQAVIDTIGRVPGGPTPLQDQREEVARMEASARSRFGAAQPAAFFVGEWHRYGEVLRNDVERVSVRAEADRLHVRAWTRCSDAGELCAAPEVAAVLDRGLDGRVASISGATPNAKGGIWFRLAPGAREDASGVILTHAYLERDPAMRVSSTIAVAIGKERQPVPLAAYAGVWRHAGRVENGRLSRVSISLAERQELALDAWVACGGSECGLTREFVRPRLDDAGRTAAVRVRMEREDTRLHLVFEPLPDGRLEVVAEARRIGPTHTHKSKSFGRGYNVSSTTRIDVRPYRMTLERAS